MTYPFYSIFNFFLYIYRFFLIAFLFCLREPFYSQAFSVLVFIPDLHDFIALVLNGKSDFIVGKFFF